MSFRASRNVWRHTRASIASLGLLIPLVFFLFVDLGGTFAGTVAPSSATWWFGTALYLIAWGIPFVLYARNVRSRIGTMAGVTLVGGSITLITVVFRDTHSTAGIGLLYAPLWLWLGAYVLIFLERWFDRVDSRSTG